MATVCRRLCLIVFVRTFVNRGNKQFVRSLFLTISLLPTTTTTLPPPPAYPLSQLSPLHWTTPSINHLSFNHSVQPRKEPNRASHSKYMEAVNNKLSVAATNRCRDYTVATTPTAATTRRCCSIGSIRHSPVRRILLNASLCRSPLKRHATAYPSEVKTCNQYGDRK